MTSRDFCYWLKGALELGAKIDSRSKVNTLKFHIENVEFIGKQNPMDAFCSWLQERVLDLCDPTGLTIQIQQTIAEKLNAALQGD